MARVTVEDCLNEIPNQFQLTLVAAKRAAMAQFRRRVQAEMA